MQGHAEFDLSEAGRAQAQRLYARFQGNGLLPTYVYSSPQRRAAETAEIVARSWSAPVDFWGELKEHSVGIFTGLTWDEISAKYPEVAREFQESRDWDIVEGAEPLRQRRARASRVVEEVLHKHADEDVVVLFTHGGILQHMLSALIGADRTWGLAVHNTAVFDFSLDLERWSLDGDVLLSPTLWRINHFNDASHLTTIEDD